MKVLDRAMVIAALQSYAAGQQSAATLAAWAFDQFYAEEEGTLSYELGYRQVLAEVLDDMMFSDDADFALSPTDVERLLDTLATVPFDPDEPAEDADDEDE